MEMHMLYKEIILCEYPEWLFPIFKYSYESLYIPGEKSTAQPVLIWYPWFTIQGQFMGDVFNRLFQLLVTLHIGGIPVGFQKMNSQDMVSNKEGSN